MQIYYFCAVSQNKSKKPLFLLTNLSKHLVLPLSVLCGYIKRLIAGINWTRYRNFFLKDSPSGICACMTQPFDCNMVYFWHCCAGNSFPLLINPRTKFPGPFIPLSMHTHGRRLRKPSQKRKASSRHQPQLHVARAFCRASSLADGTLPRASDWPARPSLVCPRPMALRAL